MQYGGGHVTCYYCSETDTSGQEFSAGIMLRVFLFYLVGDGSWTKMETTSDSDNLTWIFLITLLQLHLTSLLDQLPLPVQLRQRLL